MQKFNLDDISEKYGWNFSELKAVGEVVNNYSKSKSIDDNPNINIFIAGGAIRRPVMGETVVDKSDFDLFFQNPEDFKGFLDYLKKRYAVKESRENQFNTELKIDLDFAPKSDDPLKQVTDIREVKLQLITVSYYSDMDAVLDSFDFTICQCGYEPLKNILTFGPTALYDIARKRLMINKITYPVASLRRILKYTSQGFYGCNGFLSDFLNTIKNSTTSINMDVLYLD